ncbi:MAG: hypothetical protein WBM44_04805 [Waterburya sp.]
MNYLMSDKNTLVWFCFTVYTITALLIVPNNMNHNSETVPVDSSDEKELQFASRLILRITLLLPMIILLKNVI